MTQDQIDAIHERALEYRHAVIAQEAWQALVEYVMELMEDAARQARDERPS